MAAILEVDSLTHIYSAGTPFEQEALDGVSFSVEKGDFIGIIGHTGSGKSTLIQHLNGLLKPTSGSVRLDGRDLWADKDFTRQARFRVGLVFQYPEYQLFEETVAKDIAYGPRNMGLSDEEVSRRVEEAAGFVGLTAEQLQKSPFDLSGGQKRRVAIAGVIAMEPEVLVLDEPTAGLDPEGRDSILEKIQAYRRAKNAAVIMVSHSMEEVGRLAQRLIVMNHGKIAMEGTPGEVFSRSRELTDMGLSIPEVTKVFLRLRELGLPVSGSVYTIEQAAAELTRLKGGAAHA